MQLFGATFHQDWNYDLNWKYYDGPRYEFAIISYINNNLLPVVKNTFEKLKEFRSSSFSEDEVSAALDDFGCNLDVSCLKSFACEFVEEIYQVFEVHLKQYNQAKLPQSPIVIPSEARRRSAQSKNPTAPRQRK